MCQDVFSGKGYDQIINLITITTTSNPQSLASSEEAEIERLRIFEEYANAGLEDICDFLNGKVDYAENILLFLNSEKRNQVSSKDEFDLSNFL